MSCPVLFKIIFCFVLYIYVGSSNKILKKVNTHSKVTYQNSKYVTDVQAFTARNGKSTYISNATLTTLHAWNNNVTGRCSYHTNSFTIIDLSMPVCSGMKVRWIREFFNDYTGKDFSRCPLPADVYTATNFAIPPRNFPFTLPQGVYECKLGFHVTATKEKIVEFSVIAIL